MIVYHRISMFALMLFKAHLKVMYINDKSYNVVCKYYTWQVCRNYFTGISFLMT